MSRVANKKQSVKPFCKVCYDAGKSEELYSNHFIRATSDPQSKVVCPTLLNQRCLQCGTKGHTRNYCTVRIRITPPHPGPDRSSLPAQPPMRNKNGFQALDDESDSDETPSHNNLCGDCDDTSKTPALPEKMSYTSALLKPAPVKTITVSMPFRMSTNNRSWADSDSEDDE